MTYLVSLSFGIANCISATRASKQIYDELVRDPMRAIPDPFKKLSEKNFLCQPPPPPTFFMLPPPLIRKRYKEIILVFRKKASCTVLECSFKRCLYVERIQEDSSLSDTAISKMITEITRLRVLTTHV